MLGKSFVYPFDLSEDVLNNKKPPVGGFLLAIFFDY
jgi:hypothetical protein